MTIALLVVLVALLVALVYAMPDSTEMARRSVEAQGYTDAVYIGRVALICGTEKDAGYGFDAMHNERQARVVACPVSLSQFYLLEGK